MLQSLVHPPSRGFPLICIAETFLRRRTSYQLGLRHTEALSNKGCVQNGLAPPFMGLYGF